MCNRETNYIFTDKPFYEGCNRSGYGPSKVTIFTTYKIKLKIWKWIRPLQCKIFLFRNRLIRSKMVFQWVWGFRFGHRISWSSVEFERNERFFIYLQQSSNHLSDNRVGHCCLYLLGYETVEFDHYLSA